MDEAFVHGPRGPQAPGARGVADVAGAAGPERVGLVEEPHPYVGDQRREPPEGCDVGHQQREPERGGTTPEKTKIPPARTAPR